MRTWFVLGLVGLAGTPALAQSAACPPTGGPPASGPPVLRLAASSTISVPPDVLVADLTALANAATAVPAQHRVNALMAEAARAVAGVAGVKATFRDYSVQFVDERPARWIAQQTLELRGTDSEALLRTERRLSAEQREARTFANFDVPDLGNVNHGTQHAGTAHQIAALRSALFVFPSAIDRVRLLITFGGCRTLSWLDNPLAGRVLAKF